MVVSRPETSMGLCWMYSLRRSSQLENSDRFCSVDLPRYVRVESLLDVLFDKHDMREVLNRGFLLCFKPYSLCCGVTFGGDYQA